MGRTALAGRMEMRVISAQAHIRRTPLRATAVDSSEFCRMSSTTDEQLCSMLRKRLPQWPQWLSFQLIVCAVCDECIIFRGPKVVLVRKRWVDHINNHVKLYGNVYSVVTRNI